MLEGRF